MTPLQKLQDEELELEARLYEKRMEIAMAHDDHVLVGKYKKLMESAFQSRWEFRLAQVPLRPDADFCFFDAAGAEDAKGLENEFAIWPVYSANL